jgi:hypothetical protein
MSTTATITTSAKSSKDPVKAQLMALLAEWRQESANTNTKAKFAYDKALKGLRAFTGWARCFNPCL